ncbi:MAG TPA: hypothetical protein VIZ28_00130 [Chitinophagaceae bacterium]
MPVKWKIYRTLCIIQMLAASAFAIISLISFFRTAALGELLRVVLFTFIFMLTILAVNIVNNNYPDVPVTGKQKTNFNRLFLLNFLFLVFLFGIIFSDYQELSELSELFNRPVSHLPFELFIPLLTSLAMLIFQFIILYGLYQLRRELYFNFMKKEFEFEQQVEKN